MNLLDCRRIALIGTSDMPTEIKDFDWYMPTGIRDFDWYMPTAICPAHI